MNEQCGWLLDLYADPQEGLALWFLEESGARRRLHQPFTATFYAAGPAAGLRAAWRWLQAQPETKTLSRQERRDIFQPQPVSVLAVSMPKPAEQPGLFNRLSRAFPDLTYYDADLQLALRHAALHGTFPLAHCRVAYDEQGLVHDLAADELPWQLEPTSPPLRILSIEPDCDPQHAPPLTEPALRQRQLLAGPAASPAAAGQPGGHPAPPRPGPGADRLGRHLAAAAPAGPGPTAQPAAAAEP